jgi:phage tail-like protein
MAKRKVKAQRFDPYKNFKFRVKWDGRVIAGVSKVSALKRSTDVVDYREGGNPSTTHKSPGLTKYEPITLERGVSHDPDFEQWANAVASHSATAGQGASASDFRKDITLELVSPAGKVLLSYRIHRCWVSEFQALPDLDANSNAIVFEHVVLQNEGWQRDD